MSPSNFHFQCNSQEACRLLQLPAELKTRIYRFLLVRKDYIPTWMSYKRMAVPEVPEKSQWLSLSSQLLRTCQILYLEAEPLLYRENQITITFEFHSRPYCDILDYRIILPEWPVESNQLDLEWMIDQYPDLDVGYDPIAEGDVSPISYESYQALSKFQKIRLDFSWATFYYPIPLLAVTYSLRELVADKNVIVALGKVGGQNHLLGFWMFKCFEVWRCRTLQFEDQRDDHMRFDEKFLRAAERVIVGSDPVVDLIKPAINLHDVLIQVAGYCEGAGLMTTPGVHPELNDIWDCIIAQDERRFVKRKYEILRGAMVALDVEEAKQSKAIETCSGIADASVLPLLVEAKRDLTERISGVRSELQFLLDGCTT